LGGIEFEEGGVTLEDHGDGGVLDAEVEGDAGARGVFVLGGLLVEGDGGEDVVEGRGDGQAVEGAGEAGIVFELVHRLRARG
jgi:hypothetical protein